MPISLTSFSVQQEWEGCTWSVPSLDELANAIAIVAVGQSLHVEKILHATGLAAKPTTQAAVKGAQKLLSSGNIIHRDGWMFQVMSWLAAQLRAPGAMMNTPQMIRAHKGLDGLQVSIEAGKVTAVVIFEDKATTKPRSTITGKVWPEFKEFETGENENLITAEVTSLLKIASHPDPQDAVAEIMWAQVRRYRISITDKESTDQSQAELFKGYADTVPGSVRRRRAEIFEVPSLRVWMDGLAALAIAKTQSMAIK